MTREQRRKAWPPKVKNLTVKGEGGQEVIPWKSLRQEIKLAARRSLKALAGNNN